MRRFSASSATREPALGPRGRRARRPREPTGPARGLPGAPARHPASLGLPAGPRRVRAVHAGHHGRRGPRPAVALPAARGAVKAAVCRAFGASARDRGASGSTRRGGGGAGESGGVRRSATATSTSRKVPGAGYLPAVPGHEAAGVVEGGNRRGDSRGAPGDRVVVSLLRSCGRCFFCSAQRIRTSVRRSSRSIVAAGCAWPDGGARAPGHAHRRLSPRRSSSTSRSSRPSRPRWAFDVASLSSASGVLTGLGAVREGSRGSRRARAWWWSGRAGSG